VRRNSTSIDINHRAFAHSGDTPQATADRLMAARTRLFMTKVENGDDGPPGQPRRSGPLYQGRDMGVRWDIGLRLFGMALIGGAAAAISRMFGLVHSGSGDPAIALVYLLALAGFVSASIGSALLFLGTHIFDEVELSERWRRRR